MKKKNLSKLRLKKNVVSDLSSMRSTIGGREKSIHETNCNLCPPNSAACQSENNDCPSVNNCIPEPTKPQTCGLLCSLNVACYI